MSSLLYFCHFLYTPARKISFIHAFEEISFFVEIGTCCFVHHDISVSLTLFLFFYITSECQNENDISINNNKLKHLACICYTQKETIRSRRVWLLNRQYCRYSYNLGTVWNIMKVGHLGEGKTATEYRVTRFFNFNF